MNPARYLTSAVLLANLVLFAHAQQSAPATPPAQPPLVGSLAAHPGWPAAKNAADVDTVDHLLASLYDVISGAAGKPSLCEDCEQSPEPDPDSGRAGRIFG